MTFSSLSFIMVSSSTARDSRIVMITLANGSLKKKTSYNKEVWITLDKSKRIKAILW